MLRIDPKDRIAFWFPIALPILMGLVLAFAEFSADLTATAIVMNRSSGNFNDMFVKDLVKLWLAVSKNVGSAVFAIDLWALTTLFVSRELPRSKLIYAFPVLGIFAHFILLLVIVGVSNLANAFDTAAAVEITRLKEEAENNGDLEEKLIQSNVLIKMETRAFIARSIASTFVTMSIVVGWAVRRGVWVHHDSVLAEEYRARAKE